MVDPPRRGPWHKWFAWHPVKTDWHGWRWLTTIERRYWRGGGTSGWDYRPPPGDGYCCEAWCGLCGRTDRSELIKEIL